MINLVFFPDQTEKFAIISNRSYQIQMPLKYRKRLFRAQLKAHGYRGKTVQGAGLNDSKQKMTKNQLSKQYGVRSRAQKLVFGPLFGV